METGFYNMQGFMLSLSATRKARDGSALGLLDSEIGTLRVVISLLIEDYILECYSADRVEEAERMLEYRVRLDESDPLSWISLAKHSAIYKDDFDSAQEYIESAIRQAMISGDLYINCNIDAIEIYKKFNDIEGIDKSIKRILEYIPDRNSIDSDYSINYISSLSDVGASKILIQKYIEKFGKDR